MTYSVKYKLKGQWFWRSVKRVKGDFIAQDIGTPTRVLILENESRIELPLIGAQFKFSTERFLSIKKNMESEARQTLPVGG